MEFDIAQIDEKGIYFKDKVSFGNDYLDKTSILKLDDVDVDGHIYYNLADEIVLDCQISGVFVLSDSISLEPVNYPFNIKISEILSEELEKEQKKLDIMSILWQNIVLEVPISYTEVDDEHKKLSGEGWELVDQNKKTVDPRLAPLLELLDNEEGVK